jgi:hypothetical protein
MGCISYACWCCHAETRAVGDEGEEYGEDGEDGLRRSKGSDGVYVGERRLFEMRHLSWSHSCCRWLYRLRRSS